MSIGWSMLEFPVLLGSVHLFVGVLFPILEAHLLETIPQATLFEKPDEKADGAVEQGPLRHALDAFLERAEDDMRMAVQANGHGEEVRGDASLVASGELTDAQLGDDTHQVVGRRLPDVRDVTDEPLESLVRQHTSD